MYVLCFSVKIRDFKMISMIGKGSFVKVSREEVGTGELGGLLELFRFTT